MSPNSLRLNQSVTLTDPPVTESVRPGTANHRSTLAQYKRTCRGRGKFNAIDPIAKAHFPQTCWVISYDLDCAKFYPIFTIMFANCPLIPSLLFILSS